MNEDSYTTGERIWAVADGMGGRAAGSKASEIAIACIQEAEKSSSIDQELIVTLVGRIQQRIHDYAAHHPQAAGLGTTLAGLALVTLAGKAHWLVFSIGDSRVYRLTNGIFERETHDHCEAQLLFDTGRFPKKNYETTLYAMS